MNMESTNQLVIKEECGSRFIEELRWDIGQKIRMLSRLVGNQETEDFLRSFFAKPF